MFRLTFKEFDGGDYQLLEHSYTYDDAKWYVTNMAAADQPNILSLEFRDNDGLWYVLCDVADGLDEIKELF